MALTTTLNSTHERAREEEKFSRAEEEKERTVRLTRPLVGVKDLGLNTDGNGDALSGLRAE